MCVATPATPASRERTDLSLERGLAEGRTEDGLVPVAGREAARVVVCGRSAPVALALIAWRTPTSPTCGGPRRSRKVTLPETAQSTLEAGSVLAGPEFRREAT